MYSIMNFSTAVNYAAQDAARSGRRRYLWKHEGTPTTISADVPPYWVRAWSEIYPDGERIDCIREADSENLIDA